ncbi:MAG: integrase core domain-containing protein [Gemmatimonadaceae bacterium]|nr:integrase core domain-containing protein [Gemmatimonadaceae bacterium]
MTTASGTGLNFNNNDQAFDEARREDASPRRRDAKPCFARRTSVISGYFDPEFTRWSRALFDNCRAERLQPFLSDHLASNVNTMRRDYIAGADLSTAAGVLDQIPAWLADYNARAPHTALGFQTPQQTAAQGRTRVP